MSQLLCVLRLGIATPVGGPYVAPTLRIRVTRADTAGGRWRDPAPGGPRRWWVMENAHPLWPPPLSFWLLAWSPTERRIRSHCAGLAGHYVPKLWPSPGPSSGIRPCAEGQGGMQPHHRPGRLTVRSRQRAMSPQGETRAHHIRVGGEASCPGPAKAWAAIRKTPSADEGRHITVSIAAVLRPPACTIGQLEPVRRDLEALGQPTRCIDLHRSGTPVCSACRPWRIVGQ